VSRFQFDSDGTPAADAAVAACAVVCEQDYQTLKAIYGLDVPGSFTVHVASNVSGAYHAYTTIWTQPVDAPSFLIAEVDECFEQASGLMLPAFGPGEGHSIAMAQTIRPFTQPYMLDKNGWWKGLSLVDFSTTPHTFLPQTPPGQPTDYFTNGHTPDTYSASTQCNLLAWYWLHSLGYDWKTLTAAGGASMGAVYAKLTGKTPQQGFTAFVAACAAIQDANGNLPISNGNPFQGGPSMGHREGTWLGSPNFTAGRPGGISWIVLHTMVGTVAAADARFQNASQQASAHYGVGLDGSLVQWVDEADTAWHAGDYACNQASIGIEHEDGGNYNSPRPDALYTRSAQLVAGICARYGIPVQRGTYPSVAGCIDHRTVYATGCPDSLDTDRILREAVGLYGPGGGTITGEDMTPEQDTILRNTFNIVRYGMGASGDATTNGYALTTILPAIKAIPGGATDNAAVLAAIADLKAHPAASDPAVLAIVTRIETALKGA
jgi:hypothetical protein